MAKLPRESWIEWVACLTIPQTCCCAGFEVIVCEPPLAVPFQPCVQMACELRASSNTFLHRLIYQNHHFINFAQIKYRTLAINIIYIKLHIQCKRVQLKSPSFHSQFTC